MIPHAERADGPIAIRLVRVQVPLRVVHRSAHGADRVRDVILVRWTRADGIEGWGECPTLAQAGYVTESTDAAWSGLCNDLAPAVLAGRMAGLSGLVAAASSLADARLDAELRSLGGSLVGRLGGTSLRVPRCVVLADLGGDPEALASAAALALDAGAELVKVKIAPGADLDQLRAVVGAVGADRVAADANGTYPDLSSLSELDELGLSYLEQPLAAATTWEELAGVAAALDTPMALDESLTSPDAVRSAVLSGAADVVSIKPARIGGAAAAAVSIDFAAEHGVAAFVGGMLELGIGRATAACVASAEGCTLPTDLGPSDRYVERDICEPVVTDADGRLIVPTGPGCGRTPDPERLAQVTVDDVTLFA